MRHLIGALCAVTLLFGAAPSVAAAATVGCGRVTTFVGPNAAGSLPSGDGWVIFAKPDGSSEKVILRAGTQVGTLSGYICIGSEGVYSTGVIAPGAAGYIQEPALWLAPGAPDNPIYCGVVAASSPGSASVLAGPRGFELQVTSGPGGGAFVVPETVPLPTIGSYVAARRAGSQGVVQGAGVAVLMLVAGVALLFLARGAMPSIDSVNAISLTWAAAILLLGPAVGLAARR